MGQRTVTSEVLRCTSVWRENLISGDTEASVRGALRGLTRLQVFQFICLFQRWCELACEVLAEENMQSSVCEEEPVHSSELIFWGSFPSHLGKSWLNNSRKASLSFSFSFQVHAVHTFSYLWLSSACLSLSCWFLKFSFAPKDFKL